MILSLKCAWGDGDLVEVEDGLCVVRWIVHVARERVHSGKRWMRIAVTTFFFYHKRVQASVIVLVLEPESRKNKQ